MLHIVRESYIDIIQYLLFIVLGPFDEKGGKGGRRKEKRKKGMRAFNKH